MLEAAVKEILGGVVVYGGSSVHGKWGGDVDLSLIHRRGGRRERGRLEDHW